jgi:hypothetical protein
LTIIPEGIPFVKRFSKIFLAKNQVISRGFGLFHILWWTSNRPFYIWWTIQGCPVKIGRNRMKGTEPDEKE